MHVGIVGAGASGCMCAYFLLKAGIEVTLFDYGTPLRTLLPTGGGRCNLAHAEFDPKELAKNYPRGEKFLYSVFSKFSTQETLELFEELGIKTYTQDDGRIFPISNSAQKVREKILDKIKKAEFIKEGVNEGVNDGVNERVNGIIPLETGYKIKTKKAEYYFSHVVVATGGMNRGKCININGVEITELNPSLVGLKCDIKELSGVVLKNVYSKDINQIGDILFTHFGVSGPLVYKISSIKAFDKLPYELNFDLLYNISSFTPFDLQKLLNENPHKELKNVLSSIFPHRFAEYIAGSFADKKSHSIDGKTRDRILDRIHNFTIKVTGCDRGEETVTAGGYNLDDINSKTMEIKNGKNLYIIGEALNIDGFCGGFNLQNAWSTAYIAASSIISQAE